MAAMIELFFNSSGNEGLYILYQINQATSKLSYYFTNYDKLTFKSFTRSCLWRFGVKL